MTNEITNFFGIHRLPFSKIPAMKDLFKSSQFNNAFQALKLGLENNEDIALLYGQSGNGKSQVLRYFMENLDTTKYKAVQLCVSSLFSAGEIAKQILHDLQMEVPYFNAPAIRNLKYAIITFFKEKNIFPVIILDDAHDLRVSVLKSFKALIQGDINNKMLYLILCGETKLFDSMQLNELDALNKRIRIRYCMNALTVEEAAKYVNDQCSHAGFQKRIFTEDAIAKIFSLSKGNVCSINNICFHLINKAYFERKEIIEPSLIQSIPFK